MKKKFHDAVMSRGPNAGGAGGLISSVQRTDNTSEFTHTEREWAISSQRSNSFDVTSAYRT
jgi:hypothetical protein